MTTAKGASPQFPTSPTPHISQSAIDSYLTCPARYYRERIAPPPERRKEPVSGPLIAGRAFHTVIETLVRAHKSARKTGIDTPETRARQRANAPRLYQSAFEQEVLYHSDADWGKDGRQAHYDGGLSATLAIIETALDLPIRAEELAFAVPLTPTLTLKGRIDAILEDGRLVDFKSQTAAKFSPWRWTREGAKEKLQPAVYAAGMLHETGSLPSSFTFIVADKSANPTVETFTVPLTPAHAAAARLIATTVARAIAHGAFPMPVDGPCRHCFLKSQGGCR